MPGHDQQMCGEDYPENSGRGTTHELEILPPYVQARVVSGLIKRESKAFFDNKNQKRPYRRLNTAEPLTKTSHENRSPEAHLH